MLGYLNGIAYNERVLPGGSSAVGLFSFCGLLGRLLGRLFWLLDGLLGRLDDRFLDGLLGRLDDRFLDRLDGLFAYGCIGRCQ